MIHACGRLRFAAEVARAFFVGIRVITQHAFHRTTRQKLRWRARKITPISLRRISSSIS